MVAEWSVECSAEDPVLVVPWTLNGETDTKAGGAEAGAAADFIDLRENPYDLDQIPEADQYPPLMQALRALNAPRSAVFTAKCDAWPLSSEELEEVRDRLDMSESEYESGAAGFGSYIDLLWRDRSVFASFHLGEQLLHRIGRLAGPIDQPLAMLDCVLRPALIDLTGPQEGFAISLYVKAVAPDLESAKQLWAATLEEVVALLRGKDISG